MSAGRIKEEVKIMWHRYLKAKCFTYWTGFRNLLKTIIVKYRIYEIQRKNANNYTMAYGW